MALPSSYDDGSAENLSLQRIPEAIASGKQAELPPSESDDRRVLLLLIDSQVDFVHEDGALSIPGAVEDARRTAEWIYANADQITSIAVSLDSHIPIQIFFPSWWHNEAGQYPDPFTPIPGREVASGRWRPLYQERWSMEYVERLEEGAKKELMIWPYHTLLGTPGHLLTPLLSEALAFHAVARKSNPQFVIKGLIPETEFYSLLEPEVKIDEDPRGRLNEGFLDNLGAYDLIYLAGQAKSHCVLESVASIVRHRPALTGRLRLLEDCTSSVAHPDIDFETRSNETYSRFEQRGLRRVGSSDPID